MIVRGLWGLPLLLLSSGEGAGGAGVAAGTGTGAGAAGGTAEPAGGGAPGGGAPAKPAAPDVEVKGHTVPKHVMDEQKRAARTAEKEAAAYKAAAETAAAERATAVGQLGTLQAQLAFARVGVVDDEHVDAVLVAFLKLPEEGKPASAVEYWQQLQAGTATAPRSLLGFMAAPAAAAPAPAAGAPAATPARPALPPVAASPPPAGATVTVDMVVAAQAAFAANKSDDNRKRMNDLTAALRAAHAKKP